MGVSRTHYLEISYILYIEYEMWSVHPDIGAAQDLFSKFLG